MAETSGQSTSETSDQNETKQKSSMSKTESEFALAAEAAVSSHSYTMALNPATQSGGSNISRGVTVKREGSRVGIGSNSSSAVAAALAKKRKPPINNAFISLTKNAAEGAVQTYPHPVFSVSKREVTFPEVDIHSGILEAQQLLGSSSLIGNTDDDGSISSRGTSSTVGYRLVIIRVFF